ncbi:MAG: LPS assembly protein LptD [Chromatiales bacterium]|nr:LPS assembly protein LptD [Chromatiales bacterium]
MPGITRILPLAISGLIIAPTSQAAPLWQCHTGANGEWECRPDDQQTSSPVSQQQPNSVTPTTRAELAAQPAPATDHATPQPMPAKRDMVETPEPIKPTSASATEPNSIPLATVAPQSVIPLLDAGIDWAQCPGGQPLQQPPIPLARPGTLEVNADGAELSRQDNIAIFSGTVEIVSDSERMMANRVVYDQQAQTIDAEQGVYFEQQGLRLAAERVHYALEEKQGHAEQVEYRLLSRSARGSAETFQLVSSEKADLTQVSYTTCPPGNQDWLLAAGEMHLDQKEGRGTARDITLRFKNMPVLYLPYVSFPIDDRRKSGFLIPQVGVTRRTGVDISAPYYLNLAPNYDATLIPRLMSKRGLMLGTEFRYLLPQHHGEVQAEWLPNDREHEQSGDRSRGAAKFIAQGTPWQRWRYDINANYVSDDDYLDDLGASLAATSNKHLERRADLIYQGVDWSLLGRVQKFQTIDDTILAADRPYSRLPQILFNLDKPDQALGLDYQLHAEYVYFDKDDDVTGSRFDIKPSIGLPLRRSWGFLTPKLSARHTVYDLQDQTAGSDDSPTRTTMTFSLDSGLFYERQANWLGNAITQTLEPRLFYLYTPEENQDELPIFDSAEFDFTFASLFRDNRFSGADRIGDANQLTAALTTRSLSEATGEELFRASLGQIFFFSDREVQLDSTQPVEESSSSVIAEVAARLGANWKGRAGILWDPHNDNEKRRKSSISVHYNDNHERILNLAYRHTEELLEQTDLSVRWPLSSNLHGVARWNYSLLHDQTLERFVGIEYESCCWNTRLIAREHRTSGSDSKSSSIFLQLELKGLTSIGDRIDSFLERGILGYSTD